MDNLIFAFDAAKNLKMLSKAMSRFIGFGGTLTVYTTNRGTNEVKPLARTVIELSPDVITLCIDFCTLFNETEAIDKNS
jgi:hypothetical protein